MIRRSPDYRWAAWPLSPPTQEPEQMAGMARVMIRVALLEAGYSTPLADNAVLGTSELATNALLHACPPYELRLLLSEDRVTIQVLDGDKTEVAFPAPIPSAPQTAQPRQTAQNPRLLIAGQ